LKPKNRDNISKIIFRKKISHLGFLEFLLACAAPSPDPPELDPAAWLSIPPAAKKKTASTYLPPKRTSRISPAAGSNSPRKHNEKERRPGTPLPREIWWRAERRRGGERSRRTREKAGALLVLLLRRLQGRRMRRGAV